MGELIPINRQEPMTLKRAMQSTSVRMETGRMFHIGVNDVVGPDIYGLMSAEAQERILADWDGTEADPDDPDQEFESGTVEDPALVGAPSMNAKVGEILRWVGHNRVRGTAAYERELRKTKQRPSLIQSLVAVIDS